MKTLFNLPALICCGILPLNIQAAETETSNEVQYVQFAERTIIDELALDLSASVRSSYEQLSIDNSNHGSALDLSIGLIGVARSNTAYDTLVNLLGVKLDGGAAEDLDTQICIRGIPLYNRLKNLQENQVVEHCQAIFAQNTHPADVTVDQVCHSEIEVRNRANEWLSAMESGPLVCEP